MSKMTQVEQDIKQIDDILGENVAGTLNDINIIKLCSDSKLLIEENFDKEMVKQCCYELRSSEKYIILSENNQTICTLDRKTDDYILIKPSHQVVIITKEKLNIPGNIIGRIMTKGKLFSIGLVPVNTYADPGFKGNLGIVFCNLSNHYIKIKPGEPIAKIEFSKILGSVNKIYSGQHGLETNTWPIPYDMILGKEAMKKDPRILESELEEVESVYGKMIGQQFKKIYKYQRGVMFAFTCYVIINLVIFMSIDKNVITHFVSIIIGLITNIIWAILWYFVEKSKW